MGRPFFQKRSADGAGLGGNTLRQICDESRLRLGRAAGPAILSGSNTRSERRPACPRIGGGHDAGVHDGECAVVVSDGYQGRPGNAGQRFGLDGPGILHLAIESY